MRELITRTETITLDESGIVRCIVHKDAYMELEDAIENVKAVETLTNGKPIPVYVDIRLSKGSSKEARAYLASFEVADVQVACGLLVDSMLSQLIGNFFLGLNKTKFPVKLFKDEEKAMEWLKTYL